MEAGIINRLIVDRRKRIYKARVPYDPCYNCIANLSSQLPLQSVYFLPYHSCFYIQYPQSTNEALWLQQIYLVMSVQTIDEN